MQAKKGDRVGLVTHKRAYFFQGIDGINLGMDGEESAIIPETISAEKLNQINAAINSGGLVLGNSESKADIPDRDSDIKAMLENGRNKIDAWMSKIEKDKSVAKDIKTCILQKMVEFERAGKNRKSVINLAEVSMRRIAGISLVTETEQEKIEIKLTSGTEEEKTDE